MRCGKILGTLDWQVEEIPTLGSEKGKMTASIREKVMKGQGIRRKNSTGRTGRRNY